MKYILMLLFVVIPTCTISTKLDINTNVLRKINQKLDNIEEILLNQDTCIKNSINNNE